MDQETIAKIAAEIARHLPSYPWALLALQTVLMLAAAAGGAFFGEYLKTRGKHLATKADFDDVMSQLRANTHLVETIRAEVAQKDWAKREWTNLRRIKLEELLDQMHACDVYTNRRRNRAIEGKLLEEPDPQPKMRSLGALYFPELATQIRDYTIAYSAQLTAALALGRAVVEAGSDESARGAAYIRFGEGFDAALCDMNTATAKLTDAARKLLVEIAGVEG
jgi:hypothetical protein